MKASFPFVLAMLVGAFYVSTASAQDTTATVEDTTVTVDETIETMDEDVVSVDFVMEEAADDMVVTLRGRLVEAQDEEWYVFEDETGTILARMADDIFSTEQYVEGLEVEITGQVDKDEGETTVIEVEEIEGV